jgi:uncharacterized protein YdhG (YjbR/CyaY superfamily)
MDKPLTNPTSVAEYMESLPDSTRQSMEVVREAIRIAAPEAEELISYKMPAFRYHGMLCYYGAWKEHISLYPGSTIVMSRFKEDLAPYAQTKGGVRFPLDRPMPIDLIESIVKFRVEQNLEIESVRKNLKK